MVYHGCDQSRKLLAHYRRCRSLRARQATSKRRDGGGGGVASTTGTSGACHHCLVCSLVARQARTMLERTKTSSSTSPVNTSVVKSASATTNIKKNSCSKSATSTRKVSYVLSAGEAEALGRRGSAAKMPPPPPRAGEIEPLNSLARLYETAKQLDDLPVQRRERAVSDAETLGCKVSVDFDVRRERSASCGNAPPVRKASSPSFCETILEEEPIVKDLADELLDHLGR